jgi:hypothetical protein
MAFRIHDSVERGEIDNRVKGLVRGKIWVKGCRQPLVLELTGNAHPDLAGCLLMFVNSQPAVPLLDAEGLHPVQRGTVGDFTASRKVRVPAVPMEEFLHWPKKKGRPPTRWANCLYLEWFSQANGRIVIESVHYQLKISEPEWRLTPAEDAERARQAAAGLDHFVGQMSGALGDPATAEEGHDHERFLKESDARTAKYLELLEKYGDSAEAEEKIGREMGWRKPSPARSPRGPDPRREGRDWVRAPDGSLRHPLQQRCSESAIKYSQLAVELAPKKPVDRGLKQFIAEFETTGAKLALALNGIAQGGQVMDGAFNVARLKRALGHLHNAQTGLEAAAPKKLLPEGLLAEARQELFEIRESILRLIDEFRGRRPNEE